MCGTGGCVPRRLGVLDDSRRPYREALLIVQRPSQKALDSQPLVGGQILDVVNHNGTRDWIAVWYRRDDDAAHRPIAPVPLRKSVPAFAALDSVRCT